MEPAERNFSGEDPPPYTKQPQPATLWSARTAQSAYVIGADSPYTQCTYPQRNPAAACQGYPAGHMASAASVEQTQTTIVMTQPGGLAPVEDDNNRPPSYIERSIFSCLCCFFPLGLIAIIKSCQVDAELQRGNLMAAYEASHDAKRLANYGIVIGAGIILGIVVVQVMVSLR